MGEATLTYSLAAFTCARKEATPAVRLTSTFIVTPLAPYELILGVGWLEQHRTTIGFGERSIQLRVDGVESALETDPQSGEFVGPKVRVT